LSFTSVSEFESCEVLGLNGQVYAVIKTMVAEQKIDFSGFSNGVYFLKLTDKKGNIATQKVIKN